MTAATILPFSKDHLVRDYTIPTLEGDHRANLDDRVIRGIANEFYPCKPDIFKATYEPAEQEKGE